MSERGCTHGITFARYSETCAECGQVVAERPPNEAAMREALEGLLSLDWHSIVVPDAADAKIVLDQARRALASLSPPSTNEEGDTDG